MNVEFFASARKLTYHQTYMFSNPAPVMSSCLPYKDLHQAPHVMRFFLARIPGVVCHFLIQGSFWPRIKPTIPHDSCCLLVDLLLSSRLGTESSLGDHIRPVVPQYFPHFCSWLFIWCLKLWFAVGSACWFCFFCIDGFDHYVYSRKNERPYGMKIICEVSRRFSLHFLEDVCNSTTRRKSLSDHTI